MAYYKRIRELREDNDLTQREIARLLKMSQTQYLRYEQGLRDIPSEILIQICLIFNTSADYILELPKNLKWHR